MRELHLTGRERLRFESARAYQAYCVYRDLGPERSIDRAWRTFSATQGQTSASARRPGHWSGWAQKYKWVQRVRAYDGWLDQRATEAALQCRQELQNRRDRFALENQERAEHRVRQLDRVLDTLEPMVTEVTHVKVENGAKKIVRRKSPGWRDFSALLQARNSTALQATEGSKRRIEETRRQIEGVVWAEAA